MNSETVSMAMREVPPHFDPPGHRYTEPELEDLSKQPARAGGRGGRGNAQNSVEFARRRKRRFSAASNASSSMSEGDLFLPFWPRD